jgi:hypothetical protein
MMDKRRFAATLGLLALSLMGNASNAQSQKSSQAPAVQGSSVNSFFDSGAIVNPMSMEKASIPADQFVSLPPGHNIKPLKPGEKIKKKGFVSGVGRAFAHTCNFIGFPVGDDHDVDASLSSDLTNEQNRIKREQAEAAQQQQASNSAGATK